MRAANRVAGREDIQENLVMKRRTYLIFLLVVLFPGFVLRLRNISGRGLEYDEIFTLVNYAAFGVEKIFGDLATPNNHPLHSLLVHFAIEIFGPFDFFVRLPALLPGVALIIVAALFGRAVFGFAGAAFGGGALVAVNAMLVRYSQTSRGYSLQAFLITFYALLVAWDMQQKTPRQRWWLGTGLFVLGALAALTLPTSVLYLFPISLIHIFHCGRQAVQRGQASGAKPWQLLVVQNRAVIAGYALLTVFLLFWYLSNLNQFVLGRQFGQPVQGVQQFAVFAFSTLDALTGIVVTVAALGLFFWRDTRLPALALTAVVVFVFGSAWFVNAGEPRVYVPLIPFLCVAAAGTVDRVSRKLQGREVRGVRYWMFVSVFLVAATALNVWRKDSVFPPDWARVYQQVQNEVPPEAYVCYPPGATYSIVYNAGLGDVVNEEAVRQVTPGGLFVQIDSSGSITGLDSHGDEVSIAVSAEGDRIRLNQVDAFAYACRRLGAANPPAGSVVVAAIGPGEVREVAKLKNRFFKSEDPSWLLLNPFLPTVYRDSRGNERSVCLLASQLTAPLSEKLPLLKEQTSGMVSFYVLGSHESAQ